MNDKHLQSSKMDNDSMRTSGDEQKGTARKGHGHEIEINEKDEEWLRMFYERYSERTLKENERIWTVTSIFMPLSLAGLSTIKEATFESTLLLAIASIILISFWHLICEKSRFFQESSMAVTKKIEEDRGIKRNSQGTLLLNIRLGRWIVFCSIIGLWIAASIITYSKKQEAIEKENFTTKNNYFQN